MTEPKDYVTSDERKKPRAERRVPDCGVMAFYFGVIAGLVAGFTICWVLLVM